jgi:hypothetical protein
MTPCQNVSHQIENYIALMARVERGIDFEKAKAPGINCLSSVGLQHKRRRSSPKEGTMSEGEMNPWVDRETPARR